MIPRSWICWRGGNGRRQSRAVNPILNALKIGTRLPDAIHKEDLRPVFTTTVTRKTIELNPTPITEFEVAIDQGEIRSADGGAAEPISEIELELKRGDPAALYDLAFQLLKIAEVRLDTRSKAERGYRLFFSSRCRPAPGGSSVDYRTRSQHDGRGRSTTLRTTMP
jgi:inorganic triphosphatase YgiF